MKIFKGQGTADLGKPWRFEEDGLTVTRGMRLVASGMPSHGMRHQDLRERRRRTGEDRRRREPSHHERPPVRPLPHHPRLRVQPGPRALSHEARPRGPRQEQVGAHHLGRGIRPHCREGGLLQGELRGRIHPHHGRHRPRRRPHAPGLCAGLHRHAERLLHAVRLLVLHPARRRHHVRAGRHVSRDGLRGRPAGTLRRPDVRAARAHRVLGQGAPAVQRRRPVRPCRHRHDAPRLQAHVRRAARELGVDARRLASAAASGHRHGAGHGHAQRHHFRRPLRPRFRREMVLRLRRALRARGDHAGGEGCRDHGRGRRPHPRGVARLRQGEAGADRLGPGHRSEVQRRAGRSLHPGARGHHGQHRRSGRPAHRRRERRPGAWDSAGATWARNCRARSWASRNTRPTWAWC